MTASYKGAILSVLLMGVIFISDSLSAQSLWQFCNKHKAKFEQIWLQDHHIPTTENGEGKISAKDANGNDLACYEMLYDRAVAMTYLIF